MTLTNQLEDLHLLRCSLLPGELLIFLDDSDTWCSLLESYPDIAYSPTGNFSDAHFQIKLDNTNIWFEVELPRFYPGTPPIVFVKGDIAREIQERWQTVVKQTLQELEGSE
jgi:hypothetical protein